MVTDGASAEARPAVSGSRATVDGQLLAARRAQMCGGLTERNQVEPWLTLPIPSLSDQ
jgi:hypothetical protein